MYIWNSETLKEYSQGLIIIEGDNIEEARILALNYFYKHYEREWGHSVKEILGGHQGDYMKEDYLYKLESFKKDIKKKPSQRLGILIVGSS